LLYFRNESTPQDNLFKGDSLRLYKFFLNKLLTMSSDPFFNKKHHAFLIHQNMLTSAPNFYERMEKDIDIRKNRDISIESSTILH